MIKIINFFIPFLLEMLFGKKEEQTNKVSNFKRGFVYLVMMLSFSFNYFSINKVYTISLKYVSLTKENAVLKAKLETMKNEETRANLLKESLEFCISNTYKPRKNPGKIN